jgi:hypothetical protein
MGDNNLLTKQPIKNQLVNPNSTQSNDILINLIIGVNSLRQICPKNCVVLQMLPFFTL